ALWPRPAGWARGPALADRARNRTARGEGVMVSKAPRLLLVVVLTWAVTATAGLSQPPPGLPPAPVPVVPSAPVIPGPVIPPPSAVAPPGPVAPPPVAPPPGAPFEDHNGPLLAGDPLL